MIKNYQIDTPMTYLYIGAVKIEAFDVGGLFKIFSIGGSVESAIAAKVSMIRFTQRSWTGLSGESP